MTFVPGLPFHPTNRYAFVDSDPDNIDLLPIITINGMTYDTSKTTIKSKSWHLLFPGVPVSPGKPAVQLSTRCVLQLNENSRCTYLFISGADLRTRTASLTRSTSHGASPKMTVDFRSQDTGSRCLTSRAITG